MDLPTTPKKSPAPQKSSDSPIFTSPIKKFPTTPSHIHNYRSPVKQLTSPGKKLFHSPTKHHHPISSLTTSPNVTSSINSSPFSNHSLLVTPPRTPIEHQDRFIPARTPRSAKIRLDFSDTDQGPLSVSPFQTNLNLTNSKANNLSALNSTNPNNRSPNNRTSNSSNSNNLRSSSITHSPVASLLNNEDPATRNRIISASTAPSSALFASNITSNLTSNFDEAKLIKSINNKINPELESCVITPKTQKSLTPNASPIKRRPNSTDRNLPTRRNLNGSLSVPAGSPRTTRSRTSESSNQSSNPINSRNMRSNRNNNTNTGGEGDASNPNQQSLIDEQHFVASRLFRNTRRNLYSNAGSNNQQINRASNQTQVSNIVDQFNINQQNREQLTYQSIMGQGRQT